MWNIYKESVRKNLSDAMEHYIGCTLGLNLKEMSNKKLRLLQKDIIAFLAWCNMKRTQNKEGSAKTDATYEQVMPSVLAAYVDSSLCLSKIMSTKRRLEESTTILLKVSLLLSSKTHLYLDVLLQLRCLDRTHLDLLRPLCRKCLTQKLNSDPETYTKYLVIHDKLSSLWPKELSSELLEASLLLPPKNYLKWLERMDRTAVGHVNIQNPKNDNKFTHELMNHSNGKVLESVAKTLFKKIKVLPQPAESGESDSEDISYLSDDDYVLRNNCDANNISSSEDEDDSVSFWGKKRQVAISDPSNSLMGEDSSSDDVVVMETESIHDSTMESDAAISNEKDEDDDTPPESQNSSEIEIDLTCEDEEATGNIKDGFIDNKISEEIESPLVEVVTANVDQINNTITSPEPKATNLKRKYDDNDDDVEEDIQMEDSVHQCKRVKLSLGLGTVINLDIEKSKGDEGVLEENNLSKPVEVFIPSSRENESDKVVHMDDGFNEGHIKVIIEEKVSEDLNTSTLSTANRPHDEPEESEIKESIEIFHSIRKEENVNENPSDTILDEKVPEEFNTSTLATEDINCEQPEESEMKESYEILNANDGEESMKEDSSENIFEEKFPEDFYASFVTIAEETHDKPQEPEKKESLNDAAKALVDEKSLKSSDLMRGVSEDSKASGKHESKERECIKVNDNSSKPTFEREKVDHLSSTDVAKDFSPTGKNERKEPLIRLIKTPIGSPLSNLTASAYAPADLSCPLIMDINEAELRNNCDTKQVKHTALQLSNVPKKSSDSLQATGIPVTIEQTVEEAPQQKYSLRSNEKVSKIAQLSLCPKTRIRKPATKSSESSSAAEKSTSKKSNEESESSTVSSVSVTLEDVTGIKTLAKEASDETSQTSSSQTSNRSLKRNSQSKDASSKIPRWTAKVEDQSQENLNPALRRSARIQGKGSKN